MSTNLSPAVVRLQQAAQAHRRAAERLLIAAERCIQAGIEPTVREHQVTSSHLSLLALHASDQALRAHTLALPPESPDAPLPMPGNEAAVENLLPLQATAQQTVRGAAWSDPLGLNWREAGRLLAELAQRHREQAWLCSDRATRRIARERAGRQDALPLDTPRGAA